MARKISDDFLKELTTKTLKPILDYVKNDDTLSMCLRGNSVTIYYRGGALLTIKEDGYKLEGLTNEYGSCISPTISKIDQYIQAAKHLINFYVTTVRDHLGEKDIQQQIERENNYSPNSLDTDYFVVDVEYQDLGRFDVVAIQWDSTASARKLSKNYKPKITIFEVKQGCDSIAGKSGIKKHYEDFVEFTSDTGKVNKFIADMTEMFNQKRKLGLIRGEKMHKEITLKMMDSELDFAFILSNYKSASTKLKTAINSIEVDCKFVYANPMGYGLYSKNIIGKSEFTARFL